jgi:hypothetical protein
LRRILTNNPRKLVQKPSVVIDQTFTSISYYNSRNKCQSNADMENESFITLGWYLRKRAKPALKHAEDYYEKKKKTIDR